MHATTGSVALRGSAARSSSPRRGRVAILLATVGLLFLILAPATTPTATAAPSDWSPPSTVYIPESGQTLDGLFLDLWREGGGFESYGNPITPEIEMDDGHIVQYLDYARFEYWPEGDENGNTVTIGAIGAELRPHVVYRSLNGFGSRSNDDTASDVVQVARAWLPLDKKAASRDDTESWRYVPETKHSVTNGFKEFWERTGEAAYLGYPLTEEYTLEGTTYQVFEHGQLAWKKNTDPWMMPVGKLLAKRYGLDTKAVPQGDIPSYSEDLFIPPPEPEITPGGDRYIEVNLSAQYMTAWEGGVAVMESYVSTGRPGFDTPAGTFYVNSMLDSEDMAGVIGGEYYDVPGVPYVLYFTDVGHAIHGTYWHANFGAVMSHGCVNLPMDVAAFIYEWATIGTRVEIHY